MVSGVLLGKMESTADDTERLAFPDGRLPNPHHLAHPARCTDAPQPSCNMNAQAHVYPLVAARDVGADIPCGRGARPPRHRRAARDAAHCRHWIHGWVPGALMRTLLGEPTGTSPKFAGGPLRRS